MDLFDHYPASPGFKEPTTSRDAAASMADAAPKLRDKCKRALSLAPGTADEVAERIGASPFAVRPRITELHRLGAICPTGERRANESGRAAKVYRVAA